MKYYATLLLMIIPFLSYSQSKNDFQPGWIVTIQQDTLEGFINDQKWEITPTSISFKDKMDAEIETLSIDDISSFKVKFRNSYRSKTVQIEMLPREKGRLEKKQKPRYEDKKVFLELLVNGKKPLYYYRGQDLKEHFFIDDHEKIVPLIYLKYKSKLNKVKEKKTFVSQLETILEDCEEVYAMIAKVEYNRKSMVKMIRAFNICEPDEEILFEEIDFDWFKLGVNISTTLTHLTFKGHNSSYTEVLNFKPSLNYGIGISFDFFFPNYNPKMAFRNDLIYKPYQRKAIGEAVIEEGDWWHKLDSELNFSHLRIQSMLQCKLKETYNSTFIIVGLVNSLTLSNKSNTRMITQFYTAQTEEDVPPILDFQWYEFGLVGGFGYMHNRYIFDVKYEVGNGIGKGKGLKTSTHILYFSAKYYLN
ncbi:MAG: hypothetical protein AB8F94_18790 [Saprospiraceae bacterium]